MCRVRKKGSNGAIPCVCLCLQGYVESKTFRNSLEGDRFRSCRVPFSRNRRRRRDQCLELCFVHIDHHSLIKINLLSFRLTLPWSHDAFFRVLPFWKRLPLDSKNRM